MSLCIFWASDYPMPEVAPCKDYPLHIDIDKGTIYDGDADDNFFLCSFESVKDYTDKEYGVNLEWAYYTEGRAKLILDYIRDVLEHTKSRFRDLINQFDRLFPISGFSKSIYCSYVFFSHSSL